MSVTGLNAGDILLINNRTKNRWYNILGQKILRKTPSVNTTHVALSLGDGIFIHADTSCGVDLAFFPELLDKSEGNWKVIRHIEINDETEEEIKKSGIFHFKKAYNYGIILKESETSLFCSQFVDLAYKTIGVDIFRRKKDNSLLRLDNILPVDFERLLTNDKNWSDVTNIYLDNMNDNFFENLKHNFKMQYIIITLTKNMRRNHTSTLDFVHYLNDFHNQLPDEYKSMELESHLSEMIKDFNNNESNFLYDFWNIKSKRFKK
ncbi:YiiX/YebB-like N1pC/P60 family cysteine hydrolase [Dickeya undicola]|uniref:YiiX/YebB-like N1pC/P60 family cysteine hydrolase n=1 Tax=Dickeya undicola TaxID=1577887 RepID=UPI000907D25F|nr:YiiX/YebB-like N1pC/P60 family cysteine hydrolase [Dickeya undicola]